ncbi:MAG TPA: thioredoxin-like domain-containing protein [Phycisphaerae bacterium]|nr:thioredoxin-like domain-containing protein [Phycisphaerae bacterium]HRW53642.1 thioredoxin-like domain-containing protein [Phycisphaerae bacterium]
MNLMAFVVLMSMAILLGSAPDSAPDSNKRPTSQNYFLLLIEPPTDNPDYEAGRQKTKVTADAYRQHGARVEILPHSDLETWLMNDGIAFTRAVPGIQRIRFAQARKADGIGGFEFDDYTPYRETKSVRVIKPWFINLRTHQRHVTGIRMNFAPDQPYDLATPGMSHFDPQKLEWIIDSAIQPMDAMPPVFNPNMHTMRTKGGEAKIIGIDFDYGNKIIDEVLPASPADVAGVKVGDVILKVNDQADVTKETLDDMIHDEKNASVKLTVKRNNESLNFDITPVLRRPFHCNQRIRVWDQFIREFKSTDIEGHPFKFDRVKGKIVILDFWGTWCQPCIEKMPEVSLASEAYDDVVLVTVCCRSKDAEWKSFLKDNHLPGIHVRDDTLYNQLYVTGFPSTYIMDREGRLIADPSGDPIAAYIETFKHLEQKQTAARPESD